MRMNNFRTLSNFTFARFGTINWGLQVSSRSSKFRYFRRLQDQREETKASAQFCVRISLFGAHYWPAYYRAFAFSWYVLSFRILQRGQAIWARVSYLFCRLRPHWVFFDKDIPYNPCHESSFNRIVALIGSQEKWPYEGVSQNLS